MDHQSSEDQKLQAIDKFINNKYHAKLFTLNYNDESDELMSDLGGKSSTSSSVSSNLSELGSSLGQDDIAYVADEGEEEPTSTSEEEEEVGRLQDLEKQQNGSLYTENHEEMQPEAFITAAEDDEEEEDEEVSLSLMEQGGEEMETQELATNVDVGDDQYGSKMSSTDELNKKFEELIRKLKEEIRIEAQFQPIIAA